MEGVGHQGVWSLPLPAVSPSWRCHQGCHRPPAAIIPGLPSGGECEEGGGGEGRGGGEQLIKKHR